MELASGFGLIGMTVLVSGLVAGLVDRGPISFPMIFLGLGLALGATGLLNVDVHDPGLEVVAALTLSLVLFLDAFSLEGGRSKRDWLVPALVLAFGATVLAVVSLGPWGRGDRSRRRRPYKAFMLTQYGTNLAVVAW